MFVPAILSVVIRKERKSARQSAATVFFTGLASVGGVSRIDIFWYL